MTAGEAGADLLLRGLGKRYGSTVAVDGLDLRVEPGEFVSLLGPSGCGKTTTLRMIAGLVPPTSGGIELAGRSITTVPPHRRGMGIVFQNYALFPHLNVAQNVAFGLEMRRVARDEARERVADALAMVRLEGLGQRRIRELSGGQQQRVALARALVIRPSVLLLDEPLSNLDAKLREGLRNEIREIQRELGITALFVTHDQVEALTMSDRVAVMNEGRLEQIGTPEDVYERPASLFVATFIGRANLLPAEIVEGGANGPVARLDGGELVPLAQPVATGRRVTLMLRPHRVKLRPPGEAGGLRGRLRRTTYLGDLVQYQVEAGPIVLAVERANDDGRGTAYREGDEVGLSWRPDDALVFEAG